MIRIDSIWMCTQCTDMRCGMDKLMAQIISAFGLMQPHHAYVFSNSRAHRIKVIVHDGFGIWLSTRRLHQGRFIWSHTSDGAIELSRAQFDALVVGLPWQGLSNDAVITMI
jgi:transposase